MLTAILADSSGGTFWMPEQASSYAAATDHVFYGVYYLSVFFFALVTLLLVGFILKYRHRSDGKPHEPGAGHNTALELTWTIIPTILAMVIFYYGFRGFVNMAVEPPNAYEVDVRGKTWNWTFTYEHNYFSDDGFLHIPVNTPVAFILSSDDVIHSFFIPAFRSKKDVVPGRYNRYWVQAKKTGTFDITCAEYCGQNHSIMTSKVIVQEPAEFAEWLKKIKNPYLTHTPLEVGKMLYETRGCAQCHTIDGKANTGPTFKDMFGSQVPVMGAGTILADENYIHESILDPQAKIVQGFPSPSPMPSFAGQLNDRDINSIIGFMKSISVNYKGNLSQYKSIESTTKPSTTQPAKPTARNVSGTGGKAVEAVTRSKDSVGASISVDTPASGAVVSQVWSSNHVR
jgi:cytochrome c oxidase subunit 2